MANEEHLALLLKGTESWNQWRDEYPEVIPDLRGASLFWVSLSGADLREADLTEAELCEANLSKVNLRNANLWNVNLSGADLREAQLQGARFGGAYLKEANLDGADLSWADLDSAHLSGATLNWADLRWANLSSVDLHRADLRGATMGGTILADIDLSSTHGLEAIVHLGPSSVGIDTIYKSKGTTPPVFLRGAGVPDNFIEYMSSLTGKAFEYYSCFISYSTKDKEFAERLYADLQAKGVRCWFAPHDIQGGKKIHEQIDTAIRVHERLLLILSPDSINSEWVKTEIAKARHREVRDKSRVLFPVRMGISFDQLREWECFDADTGKDSAREIREFYIPDFSQWKSHDFYQAEFAKLLRDLTKA